MKKQITVKKVELNGYNHMPDYANYTVIEKGTTLRSLLKIWRAEEWGSCGGHTPVELSDGSWISVRLQGGENNARLTNSQVAVREDWATDAIISTYIL